jgi:DNA-binding NtrC family response regulator
LPTCRCRPHEPDAKLLPIDNDPLVVQLIAMLVANFRDQPHTVEHAPNYAGGRQRLLTGQYALCLLDYRLGNGDGLQLLREAKAQHCATPIILITGDTREETDLAAMEGGAADFIDKGDVKPDLLEQAIDYAIKTAKARQQLLAAKRGPTA